MADPAKSEGERAYLLKRAIRDALDERHQEDKDLIKEAIAEWLNEKFAQFGMWSLGGIGASILAAITYFLLIKGGWTPPK